MVNDTVSDLLTRIRNAQRAGHPEVKMPHSKLVKSVLQVLKKEGFIDSFSVAPAENPAFEEVTVVLKYFPNGEPAISAADRISKPGHRKYSSVEKLPKIQGGLGITILSTSQGVMSDREARKLGIGGEVLASIG